MLGSNDVCATIAVKDMGVAAGFYEGTLGLAKDKEGGGGVFYKSGNGGVFVYVSPATAGTNQATYAAWSVDDVASVVEELKAKGVSFEHYPDVPGVMMEGDVHVMGPAKSAWFKDPDGNILNVVEGM